MYCWYCGHPVFFVTANQDQANVPGSCHACRAVYKAELIQGPKLTDEELKRVRNREWSPLRDGPH